MLLIASHTFAQQADVNPTLKEGLFFSVAVGGGPVILIEDDQSSEHLGRFLIPNFKLGWMLSPQLALFAFIPTGMFERNDEQRAFEAIMPAIQYWFAEKYWLLGGVGVNLDFPLIGTDGDGFYTGPALCVGAGVDLWQRGKFGIDLQTRYQYGSADIPDIGTRKMSGFDLLVGFNWY
jgi:hypothetical protein